MVATKTDKSVIVATMNVFREINEGIRMLFDEYFTDEQFKRFQDKQFFPHIHDLTGKVYLPV